MGTFFRLGPPVIIWCGPDTEGFMVTPAVPKGATKFFFYNPNLFTCLLRGTPANGEFAMATYETSWHVPTGRSKEYGTLKPRLLSGKSIDGPAASYLPAAKAGLGPLLLQYGA